MLYDLHEASRLVGLSQVTLGNYCRTGRSTLERGVDFTVCRRGPWRRELCFTDRGVARLLARDYKVSYRGPVRGPGWRPPKLRDRPLETLRPA